MEIEEGISYNPKINYSAKEFFTDPWIVSGLVIIILFIVGIILVFTINHSIDKNEEWAIASTLIVLSFVFIFLIYYRTEKLKDSKLDNTLYKNYEGE